jgi:mannose-6-phosphate isomerase-like protein (cupin superfamily)
MLIRRLQDCPECTAGDLTRLRELLHPDRQPAAIRYSLAHAQLEPGAASAPHVLSSSEVYYILSGRGIMVINDEQRPVAGGQAVYIPPGAVQSIKNTAADPLAFLCIVDPAWQSTDERVLADRTQPCPTDSRSGAGNHVEKKS